MNNKRLIAQTLLEIAKNSRTEFIEDASIDKDIKEAAKRVGLSLPSPDVCVFKTVYCEIGKVNKNGVILSQDAVEKGLPTLLMKQVNFEHEGRGNLCGVTIDAKIDGDKVVTTNIFYKSVYDDKFEELKEKIKTGEASVSFEIWAIDPISKKSVVSQKENGYVEINPIIFSGTGLLLTHKPACPSAKVFKLIAKKELEDAEKIVEKIFDTNLIYASLSIEKSECKHCEKCICGGEEMTEVKKDEVVEQKPIETSVEQAKEKTEITSEPKTVETPKTEVATEETKVEATAPAAETKPVEEPNVEETPKVEGEEKKEVKEPEKAQEMEVIEPKVVVKVTRMYSDIFVDTYVDGTLNGTSEGESKFKKVTEYKDGTKDEVEEVSKYVKKYDFAEIEKAVNEAKVAKDAEIATLKAEQQKVVKEKEEKIEAQTKELGQKDQEIAKLIKPVETATEKKPEMSVGNVETAVEESEGQKGAKEIDALIAKKHQDNQ
jgi:hypothetical protein